MAFVLIAISAGGCGDQESGRHEAKAEVSEINNPYVEVLLEFRDAAESNATYDVYGYFESGYPASQRAALDAFCVIVNEVQTRLESERLSDPAYFSKRVVKAARPEAEEASMTSVRRAVRKLQTVIAPESLSPSLVKSYAKACY